MITLDRNGRTARNYRNARRDGLSAAEAWEHAKLSDALTRSPYVISWMWERPNDPDFGGWIAGLFDSCAGDDGTSAEPFDIIGGFEGDSYNMGPSEWSERQALTAFSDYLEPFAQRHAVAS